MHDAKTLALLEWLVSSGLSGVGEAQLVSGFCEELVRLGIPLVRVSVASDLLDPIYDARGFRWHRGKAVQRAEFARDSDSRNADDWQRSPFFAMIQGRLPTLRRRLDGDYRRGEFPILDEVQDSGATDYLAIATHIDRKATLGEVEGVISSWTIDRPGGFDTGEIDLLTQVVPALSFAFNAIASLGMTRTLLDTYLGQDAAARVLGGHIMRGQPETIRAVIWYSDLVNFTRIADEIDRDQLLALLNDYAECLVEIVGAQGGHVLKFMGDGILAIFPDDDRRQACSRALDAALAAEVQVATLNQARSGRGLPVTDFHLSLHVGDLLYGNIGSRSRLDFTLLGPAVNEAARIEALCRSLEQRVIVSSAFAEAAGNRRAGLVSLGRYALRGVARPQELFTIDRSAALA